MVNYLKNFVLKLLLLPILCILGIALLALFLFHPTFRLIKVKTHWREQYGQKDQYELIK
jgi:hypothetical protein